MGRATWLFAPVRTCAAHLIPLVERPAGSWSERFLDMAVVAPDDAALRAQLAAATMRLVSPLQTYVERRFDGAAGPDWLDRQRIDLAARTTEMLGAVLIHGPKAAQARLTETEWDAAGAEGYGFTSGGEDGVRAALAELVARFRARGVFGGPQAAFGALFAWLQFGRRAAERGPIESVVRDYVLDTFAVAPGTKLFGQVVAERRRHSIGSLARQHRLNRKTLNRALVMTGLIEGGDPDRVDDTLSVEAAAGERLAARLHGAVPSSQLPKRLECSRTEAEAILRSGLLPRIGHGQPGSKVLLNMISTADVEALLSRLSRVGTSVDEPSAGMCDLAKAARRVGYPSDDILRVVLDGRASQVERIRERRGVRALQVDPAEVKRVLTERCRPSGLTMAEAGRALGLSATAARHLADARGRDGRPLLETQLSAGRNGARVRSTTIDAVDRFKAEHVDLAALAAERGVPKRRLLAQLAAAGVAPILPRVRLEKYVFRRTDL